MKQLSGDLKSLKSAAVTVHCLYTSNSMYVVVGGRLCVAAQADAGLGEDGGSVQEPRLVAES